MATIYDVARQAGVSAKTVSRVLNRDAPVSRSTRETVEAAMTDLGYVPSSAARAMRSNRSGLLGLITGAISEDAQGDRPGGLPEIVIVRGIQAALEGTGLTLLISDTGGRSDAVPGLLRTFAQHRVEGIFYLAGYHKQVRLPRPPGLPLVMVNCHDAAGTPAVLPDEARLQAGLTEAVIAAGHRRIAYLTLCRKIAATPLRTEGFRRAAAAAGLAGAAASVFDAGAPSADQESELAHLAGALDAALALTPRPTALLCGNDRMAVRVLGLLRDRGLNVPDDISIAGFDNYRLIAEAFDPGLSTVELPYAAMGEAAARLLTGLIRDTLSPPDRPLVVTGGVHWRDSVATLPVAEPAIVSLGG